MWNCVWKFLEKNAAKVQLIFTVVLAIATCVLAVYNHLLFQATKEASDITRRDFELRNMSQIGITNWDVKVENSILSYRFQVEERVGAVTQLRMVETFVSPNESYSPIGLYQCHDVDSGFLLHRLGDKYTVRDLNLNLSFRSDGVATEHTVYIYVRLTHRDIASNHNRYRLGMRAIKFDNKGQSSHMSILRPPDSEINRMFDREKRQPCS